jgi:polysaccharide biosynthesis transport protein
VSANDGNLISVDFEPDNPAYVSTKSQLDALRISLRSAKELRDRLRERLATYEHRISQIPGVEQERLILRRDYDNTVRKFHEIKQKELEASLAEQLERDERGERFSLIERPHVPSEPFKPNRLGILLLGVVFSMSSGIGFASLAEFLDRTVRGARGVAALVGAPPLVSIPYVRTEEDARRTQRRFLLIGTVILGLLVLGLLLARAFLGS